MKVASDPIEGVKAGIRKRGLTVSTKETAIAKLDKRNKLQTKLSAIYCLLLKKR
jgi:hypothetical protein